ncbi:protein disulfide-isomerase A5 [Elysia marginata]|uniref:Protein disulfide-isomerase A5 n=1 Tax=Elysia marginata TaxID=1093978 RepID=A0AAV4EB63_9GAST|nr:protein disulfide-isomerase A5 [Elysia marginata]
MSKKKFIKPIVFDKYLGSAKISGLIACNYYHFLSDKDVALVMFYNPEDPMCARLKPHMLRQAKNDKTIEHGYAAVNCLEEADLCKREGMRYLPAFKLYTKGLEVNKFGDTFDYVTMDKMIGKCPIMHKVHKSRQPVDPDCPRPPVVNYRQK